MKELPARGVNKALAMIGSVAAYGCVAIPILFTNTLGSEPVNITNLFNLVGACISSPLLHAASHFSFVLCIAGLLSSLMMYLAAVCGPSAIPFLLELVVYSSCSARSCPITSRTPVKWPATCTVLGKCWSV